ncbi:hypothetical protein [Rhizobium paranaense]|uniref:Uncharacterized protein n=1 Tax=Rhizobium paranaense TaxID=1650438 RepID=A0A7W9D3A2_9HYPH|nr:hypothetical protein [Rhizobium paranaense]MBB5575960.1 hypothetical protein [Rhizobium paranaense]
MQKESTLKNREIIVERLERFKSRLDAIANGEHVFARAPDSDEYIEITPNVIVRYQWMEEICEFAIFLLDDSLERKVSEDQAMSGRCRAV